MAGYPHDHGPHEGECRPRTRMKLRDTLYWLALLLLGLVLELWRKVRGK